MRVKLISALMKMVISVVWHRAAKCALPASTLSDGCWRARTGNVGMLNLLLMRALRLIVMYGGSAVKWQYLCDNHRDAVAEALALSSTAF